MTFKAKKFGTFEDSRVVFIEIEPDKALDKFRWGLSQKLKDYCSLRPHDLEREFSFHLTIAMKLGKRKFNKIKKYVEKKPKIKFRHCVPRITLLRGGKILREYDFFRQESLKRREAKNKRTLSKTFDKLEGYIKENIDPIERAKLGDIGEGVRVNTIGARGKTLGKILAKLRGRKIFFVGDLHLRHNNIIKYCNRPFKSIREMDRHLVNNWNEIVGKNDIVYFLGDLVKAKGGYRTRRWLNKLNGNIIFIRGNHDKTRGMKFYNRLILKHDNRKFLLVHDPKYVPSKWNDWIIHGHVHNNEPRKYPLVNKRNKTINVSVEMLDYKPILLEGLLELAS